MKLTNLKIEDFFSAEAKLTFLIGAGCSIDSPSNLAAGRPMMDALIDYTCAQAEVEKIKKIEQLRFEALVEIIRNNLDEDLKVIDYYGQCDKPNLQHFFLAEMLNKGHFVMTTNFDFLIEYALIQLGIPEEQIKVIITKNDFEQFNNPEELYKQGIKSLYKIHGSSRNVITKEETRESLIATIKAFGVNKDGLNIFQVEPFKISTFNNISRGRSIVIMGYSGGDDFDIVPTLKILKNLKNVIWIDFVSANDGTEEIYEIDENISVGNDGLHKINQILVDIKTMNHAEGVYRVMVNTPLLLKRLLEIQPELSSTTFSLTPKDWLNKVLIKPGEFTSTLIALTIYSEFNNDDDSRRCIDNLFKIVAKLNNEQLTVNVYLIAADFYRKQEEFQNALKYYQLANQIGNKLRYGDMVASTLNGIANIHQIQGNFSEALKLYESGLQISREMYDYKLQAEFLNNIGLILKKQGNYYQAIKMYEASLQIYENLGNLRIKSTILNNIGVIFNDLANYHEALKRFEISLEISNQLHDLPGSAKTLISISEPLRMQGKLPEAMNNLNKALHIIRQLGSKELESTVLNNLGLIHFHQNETNQALEFFKKALLIDEELGNLSQKIYTLNNVGEVHRTLQKFSEASKCYNQVLEISERQGNLVMKAASLNNLGLIFYAQAQFQEALNLFFQALDLAEQTGVLYIKAQTLNNIGTIYSDSQNYPEALKWYQQALKINETTNNLSEKALNLKQIGAVYYMQGKESEAFKLFIEGINIKRQLGLSTPEDDQLYEKYTAQFKSQGNLAPGEEEKVRQKSKLNEIASFRGAQIMQSDAEILNKLEQMANGNFTLTNSIYATTKLGFSIENFRVTGIGLNQCWLNDLPSEIKSLSALQRLVLNGNNLKILPETIGDLTSLTYLTIFNNQLEEIPESIGNLNNLQTLQLDKNNLRNVPDSIGNLESLQELIISENQLESLPESIGNLKSLKTLSLGSNNLTTLPESVANLINLQELYIYSNKFINFPNSISILEQKGVYISK